VSSHSHHGVNFMKMKPDILGNRILEKQKKCFSMHYNYNEKSRQIFSLEISDNSSPHPIVGWGLDNSDENRVKSRQC